MDKTRGPARGRRTAAGPGAGRSRTGAPMPQTGKTRHALTRRGLFRASAAAGLATAAVGVLAGCKHGADEVSSDPVVVDTKNATYVIDPNTNESNYKSVNLWWDDPASYDIALGTVLRPGEGDWLAATSVGTTTSPIVKAAAFSVTAGTLVDVVTTMVTQGNPNIMIYDVRCSDSAYAWVEMNLLDKSWALYASAFEGGALIGSSSTLWQADGNWDPPQFVVTGNKVIWQVMPSLSGNKTAESSVCYVWKLGGSEATAAVESPGRFATPPELSGDVVTLCPRVRADEGVYYGITAYSVRSDLDEIVDQLVLPQTVKPLRATRIGEQFVFSIEASYQSGGLLGTMGTYIGTSEGKFVVLSREPYCEAAGTDGVYIIKSRTSYFVVDTQNEQYAILSPANRAVDYGDFPARDGECSTFVTFATIKDPDTGYPSGVRVRAYAVSAGTGKEESTSDSDDQAGGDSGTASDSTAATGGESA